MNISQFNSQPNSSVFVFAALSANHNGKIETAIETIRSAKRAIRPGYGLHPKYY